MTTKQRVFSQNNIIYYNDYLKLKKGTECLKTINRDSSPTINQFVNYEQFLYLSKAFYKQVNMHKCKNEYLTNLYNANVSYIQHNNNAKTHIDLCNPPVLYPYGQYKHSQSDHFYFPYKLDMTQICCKNKTSCDDILLHITCENNQPPISNCTSCNSNNSNNSNNKCKTGLCKNAKQLFI
jgi:hypothetical protein